MREKYYDRHKLQAARKRAGLSVEQVARTLEKHPETIRRMERGTNFNFELLWEMARLYETPLSDILQEPKNICQKDNILC